MPSIAPIRSHWQHDTDRDDVTAYVVRIASPAPRPNRLGTFHGEVYDQAGVVVHRTDDAVRYDDAAALLDRWLADRRGQAAEDETMPAIYDNPPHLDSPYAVNRKKEAVAAIAKATEA